MGRRRNEGRGRYIDLFRHEPADQFLIEHRRMGSTDENAETLLNGLSWDMLSIGKGVVSTKADLQSLRTDAVSPYRYELRTSLRVVFAFMA